MLKASEGNKTNDTLSCVWSDAERRGGRSPSEHSGLSMNFTSPDQKYNFPTLRSESVSGVDVSLSQRQLFALRAYANLNRCFRNAVSAIARL